MYKYIVAFFILLNGFEPQAQTPNLLFNSILKGDLVVPSSTSQGTGMVSILFNFDQSKILLSGMLLGIEGNIQEAALYVGNSGINGPVILDIMPVISGKRVGGELSVPAGLLSHLLRDRIYLEIKSSSYPNGAIRGQMAGETDVNFSSILTGNQMVPANATTGYALGGFHFPTGSEDVDYAFVVQGLSSPLIGADLYRGAPGENGIFITDLPGIVNGIVLGLRELDELEPDFIQRCIQGEYYVVIKTANFPNGEIRGQMNFLGYLNAFDPVNGIQQVPSVSTPAFGLSYTQPNETLDSLTTTTLLTGLTAQQVTVHLASSGQTGPAIDTLTPTAFPGLFQKTFPVSTSEFNQFILGRLYLNAPSIAYPNGEIRGQLTNSLRKAYTFDLCGQQVVPPVATNAYGVAMASVDQPNCYLNYKLILDGFQSPAIGSFIQQGAIGQNGAPLYLMPLQLPLFSGYNALLSGEGALIESGMAYISVHTDSFMMGEIRGQFRRALTCPATSSITELPVRDIRLFPNPANHYINIELQAQTTGQVIITDLLGRRIFTQPLLASESLQTITASCQEWPKGHYEAWLESGKQLFLLGKFIKK